MREKGRHGIRAPCIFVLLYRELQQRKLRWNMRRKLIMKADTGRRPVEKAYEIRDAEISFVSLVKKAANKRTFLITKSDEDGADFEAYGRIVCSEGEADTHYVTGIVYEPLTEDSQGNYMTEEEIVKAAHWFAKNANQVDVQHSFQKLEGASVVESSVAKCDMELAGQPIKKGTWLMTVEITDPDVNEKIAKGEITGFSMGGHGKYSTVDVELDDDAVSKSEEEPETRNILKAIAEKLGIIKKGKVVENYKARTLTDNFWAAFYALQDVLMYSYNAETDRWERQTDESTIRAALSEFNDIVVEILTSEDAIFKSADGPLAEEYTTAEIEKAGKSMSEKNRSTLKAIHDNLGAFLAQFEDTAEKAEEDKDLKKSEVEEIVKNAIAKAFGTDGNEGAAETGGDGGNPAPADAGGETPAETDVTAEAVEKMVSEAIVKAAAAQLAGGTAAQAEEDGEMSAEAIVKMVDERIAEALEPVLKSAGLPTNLNGKEKKVEKAEEQHYLHGIL